MVAVFLRFRRKVFTYVKILTFVCVRMDFTCERTEHTSLLRTKGQNIQVCYVRKDRTCKSITRTYILYGPIPVAARSKAWICDRSLAGIAGSNSAVCMDVCLL